MCFKRNLSQEIPAGRFYSDPGYSCPKCHTALSLSEDENPMMVQACDVMFDRCSACGTYIIINMLEGRVRIEGYANSDKMHARGLQLGAGKGKK